MRHFQIVMFAFVVIMPTSAGAAADGPCPGTWLKAKALTQAMTQLTHFDDGQAEQETELSAVGVNILGRDVSHVFLNDNIGGGSLVYVFDAPATDVRAAVFQAYEQSGSCDHRKCVFAPSRSGELDEATVANSYRALTETGTRRIEKPSLICGYSL